MPGQAAQGAMKAMATPGVKDPLQNEQTAYEILGVDRGATDADVQTAFAMRLKSGVSVQKLTSAKRVLQSPNERALVDLFQYIPEWARDLAPSVLQQPTVLDLARRGSTAQAWENQLRKGFPDLGAAHSLAVLWYWWALREEDQIVGVKQSASAIPADQMWQKAIACWAMVLSSEEFWSGAGGIGRDAAAQVSTAIIDRLTGRLHESAQKHRGNNSAGLVARYQELELALTTELRTAKQVSAAGIRTSRGKVVCGVLMLQQVELLETVRQQVSAGLKRSPSSENLRKLESGLSRFASIAMLIDANKPQTALDALDALPRKEQEAAEAQSLRVRALHALAQQQASLNNLDDALGTWEQALRLQPTTEIRTSILSAIVSGCQKRAATLQRQPELAITLLERGLKLSGDPGLKLLLAELLTNGGIKVINEAQSRLKSDGPSTAEQVKRDIKKGVDDLERAATLGSRRASEQLAPARDLYEQFCAQVDSGFIFLSPEAAELLVQARQTEDLDEAIRLMRSALSKGNDRSASVVKKQLAELLAARAIQQVNGATSVAQEASKQREGERNKEVGLYLRVNGPLGIVFVLVSAVVTSFGGGNPLALSYLLARFWPAVVLVGIVLVGALSEGEPLAKLFTALAALAGVCAVVTVLAIGRSLLRKIVAWWRETKLTGAGYRVYDSSTLLCQLCFGETKYEVPVPGRGRYRLCEDHAKGLQSVMNDSTGDSIMMKAALDSAFKDLAEAVKLDPQSSRAQDALGKVTEMLLQFQ